jgi:hypothetical protein
MNNVAKLGKPLYKVIDGMKKKPKSNIDCNETQVQ